MSSVLYGLTALTFIVPVLAIYWSCYCFFMIKPYRLAIIVFNIYAVSHILLNVHWVLYQHDKLPTLMDIAWFLHELLSYVVFIAFFTVGRSLTATKHIRG